MKEENILGQRINELLDKYNKSQRNFAKDIGISEVSLSRYIRGERIPSIDVLTKIANGLYTTPNYLLGYETSGSDYNNTYFLIKKNVDNWTDMQKAKLVLALFGRYNK